MKALLLALAGVAVAAHAQTAAVLVPAQSEIVFTSTQMGVPVEGRFRRFDAAITLDPKQPAAGSVALTIDTASATLGLAETDAELAKPGWFDTRAFPQASFRSSAIKALGAGRFEVSGALSIKGTSQPLVVPVTVTQAGATSTATGRFTISRLAFKIGAGEWSDTSLVADAVAVRFRLVLGGIAPL